MNGGGRGATNELSGTFMCVSRDGGGSSDGPLVCVMGFGPLVMGCETVPMGVDEQTGSPTSGLMSRGLPIGCAYKSKRSWRSDSVGLTDRASDVGNA